MKTIKLLILSVIVSFSTAQAASLKVQALTSNPGTLPKNAIRVPFLTLSLQAQQGDVTINNFVVERSGLSSNEDFGRIWAETADYRRTTARSFNNDSQVELEFRNGLVLKENQTTRVIIFANLEFSSAGRTAAFNLISIDHDAQKATPEPTEPVKVDLKKIAPSTSNRRYDNTKYRIKCTRGKCRLVPRD